MIENDSGGNVETGGVFDPAQDGIDFHESLEGMLVRINNAVAVGPTNDFGEIAVVGDNGAGATVRTSRGGIVIRPNDFNPERLILDDVIADTPDVNVRDRFPGAIDAVVDYNFGNFKYLVTATPSFVSGGLTRQVAEEPWAPHLTVATFNVENLDPSDRPPKWAELADLIVDHLRSPDIIAIEEIQDNNGAVNDARHQRVRDVDDPDRDDRRGGRAAVRVPRHRARRRPGRRRARRQHPRRLPVPHRSAEAGVRGQAGRRRRPRRTR